LSSVMQSVSSALQGDINSLNTRVDNVLSNVDPAALDSLSEIVDAFQAADGDINNAITNLAGAASTNLASVSSALAQAIADEVTRSTGIESGIQSALDTEVTARGTAITSLGSDVDGKIASLSGDMVSRDAAVLAEAKGYTDTAISDLIDGAPGILDTLKELASAIGGDDNYFVHVAEQIAALSASSGSGLSSEITRATNAEIALGGRVDGVSTDVTTERTRATNAEVALGGRIDGVSTDVTTERTRALSAESGLASDITAEETRALAAEAGLDADIVAERTRAMAAESGLTSDIASLNTRVDNVLSNVDATALNSLAEIVTAFQAADGDINNAITSLAGAASTNLASVSSTLAGSIADEVTRAGDAEVVLGNRATDIEGNYLDKRVGGTVAANLAVTGNLEVGSGATTLFVEAGKVGVNTETPSEALDVSGNLKISGNFIGSGTSAISGFIMDGGSF